MNSNQMIKKLDSYMRRYIAESLKPGMDPKDLYQEMVVVVLEVTRRYKNLRGQDLINMVKRCVCNKMRDIARRRITVNRYSDKGPYQHNTPTPSPDPSEVAEHLDLMKFALSRMRPEMLDVMRLVTHGDTVREAAKKCGMNRSTAFRHLKNVRREAVLEGAGISASSAQVIKNANRATA